MPSANNDGHLSHHQNLSLNLILPADLHVLGNWYVESGIYFSLCSFQERHGMEELQLGGHLLITADCGVVFLSSSCPQTQGTLRTLGYPQTVL